jgi:hypothetical protein
MTASPIETEAQARELPAVRVVHDAFRADPSPRRMAPRNHRLLCEPASAAGGGSRSHDHRILPWLAGYEPETCAVIAGIITRATAAGQDPLLLTPSDRRSVLDAPGCGRRLQA